ncbi:hypothetical protein FM038_000735 [Shewanella eurypsychrophilus]|uniref:Uncharacterized protein n=1 Tax=Shewanella eurypsychrophilus TaxID=2593656 RepID=A0ABX6V0G7_9GAMM|nr:MULTISPECIES: hypothetical protein [Shewanella]QFU20544.1 hypothetical protein FS418_00725 [Shewanella sp. YLB-09]QFU20825.1 hypothetical protein FS418_02335 [Shewanella sp. YLB-09]QPG56115.1 hypothetical protein FM038_000735 [Shewanella eurypsychrophilus]
MNRIFTVIIILLSLCLLIPGVTQPILSISGSIDKSELAQAGMGEMLKTSANFEVGFYYFSAYCLFSLFSGYLVHRQEKITKNDPSLAAINIR